MLDFLYKCNLETKVRRRGDVVPYFSETITSFSCGERFFEEE